ncbi:hypothetical protein [Actinomadura chibensis]|uniref:Uncharacterized protein n=1 Tax=Actinomadura chibensis TaxID=392828 RepID=A0A5D0NRA9_9ACTN|nr:hypothetical protein [Actinomadura chibensis]TYB46631.1 hypothetical protein FXF69_15560 [Actinomadura chibensis]
MGVDHTSGTDTKTETTDQPRATAAYQPPPDRPGSPGQPSRAESRAAARAPAETESAAGERDEEHTTGKPEPEKQDPAEGAPEQPQDLGAGKPDAEKDDAPQTAEPPQPEDEPVRGDGQDTPRGPRAESRAQTREAQSTEAEAPEPPDEQDAQTGGSDAPGQEPQAGTARTDAQSDTGETNTEPTDSGQQPADRDSPGSVAAPEENGTDKFAGLPTRADLDPAGAGELTRERGEPLGPVNENQDLREPDPERDSDWKRLLRNVGTDTEDAIKTGDALSDTTLKLTRHRPPTELNTSTRDNSSQVRDVDHSANIPTVATGVLAAAIVLNRLVHAFRTVGGRIIRRSDDGSHR